MEGIKTGWDLVADERKRQLEILGYDATRDDQYPDGELSIAAACYAVDETNAKVVAPNGSDAWPWPNGDKRNGLDGLRKKVIAAALLMADIDKDLRKLEVKS